MFFLLPSPKSIELTRKKNGQKLAYTIELSYNIFNYFSEGVLQMGKNATKIIALVLVLSMLLVLVPCASATTGDEVRAAKKVISVVYDDSGSMFGDRWVYANYAMQALTALLNTQDDLYITYMSEPSVAKSVDLANLNSAVSDIRNWNHSSGTPGEALDTAKKKLDSLSESDRSAQFWLMILTDGEINMSSAIQEKLNSFKGSQMSNGSVLNVVYLAMGSGAIPADADEKHGLYTFQAENHNAITNTMTDIANLVSSRLNVDKVTQAGNTAVSFKSDLPLYSISVLTQQSSAFVVEAASQEEKLNIDRNIELNATEPFGNTQTQLYGNAAVINRTDSTGANQLIQAGTYTITFSEPVDISNLVIQYEPAIGMKMILEKDGIKLNDVSSLKSGDKVNVELIPVIPGTDQPISASSLPKDISWQVEYIVDSNVEDTRDGQRLSGITLLPGDNIIRGTMQLPGFAPSVSDLYFPVSEFVYDLGIQADQPDDLSYYRSTSGNGSNNGGHITFHITNEGIPLTKDQQKDLDVKLKVDSIHCDNSAVEGFLNRFGKIPANCNLKQNDDGSYSLIPKPAVPFTAFLTMAGVYTVTVNIDTEPGITATGTFTLIPRLEDWKELGGLVATLLLLLYLIYIIFIKYKFTGQTVCYQAYKLRYDGSGMELVNDAAVTTLSPLKNILSLKRASETKFYGLTLQAGPDGTVIVTGKSIAKLVSNYKASGMDPKISLDAIAGSMQATQRTRGDKTERVASDQVLSAKRPVYFRTEATDTTIWCLHLMK